MKEIQKKNIKDLRKLLFEKREEARSFRFGTAGSKMRDVRAVRKTKRDVARILAELNQRAKVTE